MSTPQDQAPQDRAPQDQPARDQSAPAHAAPSHTAPARSADGATEGTAAPAPWCARVVTLFPQAFPGTLGLSLTGRALEEGLWQLQTIDLRPFGAGRHRAVDDTPAGGGAGMVLRADVVARAVAQAQQGVPDDPARWPLLYLSPRGRPFTQAMAAEFSRASGMTLLCGRFEGLDQRALDVLGLREVSIGDYVLTGGELAAQVVLDATVRLLPQVLGNPTSHGEDSFSAGLLEYPHYTRPTLWQGRGIPEVLLSGHHGRIRAWRQAEAERLTRERRPDLWAEWLRHQNRP